LGIVVDSRHDLDGEEPQGRGGKKPQKGYWPSWSVALRVL
jgi:hypothetical protein